MDISLLLLKLLYSNQIIVYNRRAKSGAHRAKKLHIEEFHAILIHRHVVWQGIVTLLLQGHRAAPTEHAGRAQAAAAVRRAQPAAAVERQPTGRRAHAAAVRARPAGAAQGTHARARPHPYYRLSK